MCVCILPTTPSTGVKKEQLPPQDSLYSVYVDGKLQMVNIEYICMNILSELMKNLLCLFTLMFYKSLIIIEQ